MSRGNVFKLSGNNVLGNNNDYQNSEIQDIKNSLKLLKSKKNQRQSSESQGYGYNAMIDQGLSNKNYNQPKPTYNYEGLSRNHIPNSQKDFVNDYSGKKYTYNDQPSQYGNSYSNKGYNNKNNYSQQQSYDYSTKPSYSQQTNSRNSRNIKNDMQDQFNSGKYNNPTKSSSSNVPRGTRPPIKNTQPKYEPKNTQQYEHYNERQEKSIKEVNRENQVDIIEYDPSELKQCRMGCGRKFNPDSIAKHEKNCKKVFQKKRKQFDSQKHRFVDQAQTKLMKQGEKVEKKIERARMAEKVPKWKAQSLAFRAQLKQNRGDKVSGEDMKMIQQAEDTSRVQCKFCGRKFNEQAATRHIKFCEEQSRKNALKKKK